MTVERYDRPTSAPALVNPTTDSWTAVLKDVVELAENIAPTEFVPYGLRGSVAKTVAAILHGRELGLPPMTALSHTQVINGRPGTSAEVMRALILQAGHDLDISETSATRCVIRGRRQGWAEDRWTRVTFTIEDAAKAGLLEDKVKDGKRTPSMYRKWPQAMLLARASTILARMIFADVIHGMRSVEELQDMTEAEWVEVVPSGPETATVSRQSGNGQPLAGEPAPEVAPSATGAEAHAGTAESEQQPAVPAAQPRKRVENRRRTMPSPPPADPEPEPDTLTPALVEEAPENAEPVPPTPLADAREKVRRDSMVVVQRHWERILGKPVDRDERIWWTRVLTNRPDLESTNDLDSDGIRALMKELEHTRDRAALEARLTAKPESGDGDA